MASNLHRICGNRAALEEEVNVLQELVGKEKCTVEHLRRHYEEQKSASETEKRIVAALRDSKGDIYSLQQATNQLLQSIKHVQATFVSALDSQQNEDVATHLPANDKFLVDWRLALDGLTGVSDLLDQRLSDTMERARANQTQLLVHDSLRAHAMQAMSRMEASIRELQRSIDEKRLGILHPMRRVSIEIFMEIFEHAVDMERAELEKTIDHPMLPQVHLPSVAFNISATCRDWRGVATRTPKLWRYICAPWTAIVYDGLSSSIKLIGQARFLRCLSLAGECGLELILRGEELECWKPILMEESTRQWSCISIINTETISSRLPTSSHLSIYSRNSVITTATLPGHLVSASKSMDCFRTVPQFTSPATYLSDLYIYFSTESPNCPDLGTLLSFLPSLSALRLKCSPGYGPAWDGPRTLRVHDVLRVLDIPSQLLPYIINELQSLSIPSLSVLWLRNLHEGFATTHVSQLVAAPSSIKDTVTVLRVSSGREISKKEEISALIWAFSQLKRLELHHYAVTPALEALCDAGAGPKLEKIIVKSHPEGNASDKLREAIEKVKGMPRASSWKISY